LRKVLWFIAAALAALALVAAAGIGAALWLGERKLARAVEVRVVPVPYARDAQALKLGKYLYDSRGCADCHGADGSGRLFIDDARSGMRVRAPNITRGANGAVAAYGEADWVRTIRHGVSPAGHALLAMPSEDYSRLTDADFAALVAYVRSLAPAAGEPRLIELPGVVKALYGVGVIRDAAEKIDHRLPPAAPVPIGATPAHGAYVATMCVGCHGATFAGGPVPGAPPDWPPAANLTPGEGSAMARYDDAGKFVAMMRTGRRPDGSEVSRVMPFASLRNMNDVDLNAVYAYLATLPARRAGER
jgi:mono/diheme cytochrome c family protein